MSHPSYHASKLRVPYDAIVIGSGIGGLTAAALLAQQGQKVLVLEQHYVAGGFTHTFTRKGFEWDVGVHYVGEVHRAHSILKKLFDRITERKLRWAPMPDVYDRVIIRDRSFNYVSGKHELRDQLLRYFPSEEPAVDGYFKAVTETARCARYFFTHRTLNPVAGALLKPFWTRPFYRYSDRTTYDVLSSLTDNQELIGLLSAQYGDYGMPPRQGSFAIHAMVARHYFEGGSYPIGGSSQFFDTIEPVIQKSGGQTLVRAGVQEILVRDAKAYGVRLADGDEIGAKLVISNAGVANTFGKLLSQEVSEAHGLKGLLSRVKPSLAHICLYLGLDRDAQALGLQGTNLWIYPDYDHDRNIENYLRDPTGPLPVVYVSFPSAKDPSFSERHPGKSTIEVVGFTPYSWFEKWEGTRWMKRSEDYLAFKEKLTARLLAVLHQHVPQVRDHIVHQELSTPLSTRHFCNYDHGEIYGIEHTPQRFRQSWLRPQTPIQGLYLTGQDIVTDGIGGATMAGLLTASVVLKKNLLMGLMRQS